MLNQIADMIAKTLILLAACIVILYAGFNLYVDHQLRSALTETSWTVGNFR